MVNAATDAAVRASISTPVLFVVLQVTKISTELFLEFNLNSVSTASIFIGWHKGISSYVTKQGFIYVLPNKTENEILKDGFFAAKLIKND